MIDPRLTYWPSSGSVGFVVNGVRVLLSHDTEPTSPAQKEELALELLERGLAIRRKEAVILELEKRVEFLKQQRSRLEGMIPPESPKRLFGSGIVRVDERGRPWVMDKPDPGAGWGSYGVCYKDWDDLFRYLNIRIVGADVDKCGPLFRFENKPHAADGEVPK